MDSEPSRTDILSPAPETVSYVVITGPPVYRTHASENSVPACTTSAPIPARPAAPSPLLYCSPQRKGFWNQGEDGWEALFTSVGGKAVSLVCGASVAVVKEYNLKDGTMRQNTRTRTSVRSFVSLMHTFTPSWAPNVDELTAKKRCQTSGSCTWAYNKNVSPK